jgi:hypothetical protein
VNATVTTARAPARRPAAGAGVAIFAGAIALSTAALMVATEGNPIAVLSPVLLAVLAAVAWSAPLRYTVCGLLFLALATESPGDAGGFYESPFFKLGALLHANLNQTVPVNALRFTGVDVLIFAVSAVVIVRRAQGELAQSGAFWSPRPLIYAALGALLTVAALTAYGVSTGGDPNQVYWQTHQFVLVPILFFLLDAALRGPRDHALLAKTFLAAAGCKALLSIYVGLTVRRPDGLPLQWTTSHGDSVLFAAAVSMLAANFIERPTRRRAIVSSLLALPLLAGMVLNNRRLVWVELAGSFLCFYALSFSTPLKRSLTRLFVLSLPLLILYIVAGWGSGSRLFKPVQTIRSVVESKSDRSTEERDVENFNLLYTLRSFPLAGLGFGHGYIEAVKGDDISNLFSQYRQIPHNSLLGVWAFGGVAGFTGICMFPAFGVFFAARAYRRSQVASERAAALTVIGVVLLYLIQCYGDMGFVSWTGSVTLAAALCVAGKLAVAAGAWPPRRRPFAAGAAQ